MGFLEAIVLAIVQALTEFLPVSSSGHLVVLQYLFGLREPLVAFDVLLHVGSLIAVLIFFRRQVIDLAVAIVAPSRVPGGRKLIGLILLSTVCTAVIGLGFQDFVEAQFQTPAAVGLFWILTAGLLFGVGKFAQGSKLVSEITISDAALIGLFQGVAILPGVSRAGATIVAGMMCGLHPKEAANYAFLIFIPAILGASVLKLKELSGVGSGEMTVYVVATLVAVAISYAAIWILFKLLQRRMLQPFAWYCLGAGSVTMIAMFAAR
jgi:undecaprenyl-diphosphatase